MDNLERALTLLAAVLLDLLLGEPPGRFHPVVWIGSLVSWLERRAPSGTPTAQFIAGLGIVSLVLGSVLLPAFVLERLPRRGLGPARLVAHAWLLKCTFSLKGLWKAGDRVAVALAGRHDDAARVQLKALVSRNVEELDKPLLAAAAVESLAENTCDSFVAPALYYGLFGLPGAFAYRAVNTMDSMLGYRGAYEFLGKPAARLDDFANLLPARLAALLLIMAGALLGRNWRQAVAKVRQDARKTESPNAGWPMSAMAGALGVELEKVGHYRLGAPADPPDAGTIKAAIRLSKGAAVLATALLVVVEVLRNGRPR